MDALRPRRKVEEQYGNDHSSGSRRNHRLRAKPHRTLQDDKTDVEALESGSSLAVAVAGISNGAMSATDKSNLDVAYAARTRIASLQVRATVTLTANATSQVLNLDSAIPANSRIQSVNIKLATSASGGGATSCTAKIGSSGDDDAIVASANLFAAAVDGQCSSVTLGIAPRKQFLSSTQLTATITSDVNVSALTALVVTFEVAYQVIA